MGRGHCYKFYLLVVGLTYENSLNWLFVRGTMELFKINTGEYVISVPLQGTA